MSQSPLSQQKDAYPGGGISIDFDDESGIASICDLSGARLLEKLWGLGRTLDGPLFLHNLACHADGEGSPEFNLMQQAVLKGVHSERLHQSILHRQHLLLLLLRNLLRHLLLLQKGLLHGLLLLLLLTLLLHH